MDSADQSELQAQTYRIAEDELLNLPKDRSVFVKEGRIFFKSDKDSALKHIEGKKRSRDSLPIEKPWVAGFGRKATDTTPGNTHNNPRAGSSDGGGSAIGSSRNAAARKKAPMTLASQMGKLAVPATSSGSDAQKVQGPAAAPVLAQKKKRSKNKFKPDPEPEAALEGAHHSSAKSLDQNGTTSSPAIALTNAAQQLAGPVQRKKRSKKKFKPDPLLEAALDGAHRSSAMPTAQTPLPESVVLGHMAKGVRGSPAYAQGGLTGSGNKKSKKKVKHGSEAAASRHTQNQRDVKSGISGQSRPGQAMASSTREAPATQPTRAALAGSLQNTAKAGPVGARPSGKQQHGQTVHADKQRKQQDARGTKAQLQAQQASAPAVREAGQGKESSHQQLNGNGAKAVAVAKVAVRTVTAPPSAGAGNTVSANWAALKAHIAPAGSRKRPRLAAEPQEAAKKPEAISDTQGVTPVLAVDCEMVGAGPEGKRSLLARVCVVNQAGNVLLDEHVAQKERVTDYRTRFSGIRPSDLADAPSLEEVQARVAAIFKGRIVVGHSITNDLTALLLSHPRKLIRDTARYPPLMRATAPGRRPKPRALRHLATQHLGLTIQAGEHSPVDDARAALYLYLRFQKEWEHHMECGTISQLQPPLPVQQGQGKGRRQRTLEELAAADQMVDL